MTAFSHTAARAWARQNLMKVAAVGPVSTDIEQDYRSHLLDLEELGREPYEDRIARKAQREKHEWRWATWTPAPTDVGGALDDEIDIRDVGRTVWTVITVRDYLKGEA